jgi:hypothetical protein
MKGLQFEFERIKNSKKIIIASIVFLIITIIPVYLSILKYESFLKEKEKFVEYEKLRVQSLDTYQNYGIFGNRVLLEKLPIDILIKGSSFNKKTESNIDINTAIRIVSSERGKSRFAGDQILPVGFGDWIYLLGSFAMLLLGVTAFKSPDNIKLLSKPKYIISSISYRALVSLLFFFFALAYFIPVVSGIKFSGNEVKTYLLYSFYTLLLMLFFFIAGVSLAPEKKEKKGMKYLYAVLFWLLTAVGIPGITSEFISLQANKIQPEEALNVDKFKRLMDFEKASAKKFFKLMEKKGADPYQIAQEIMKEYMEKIFPANNQKEEEFLKEEKSVMKLNEACSLVFPTAYHHFLSKEMPGSGDYTHLLLMDYIKKLREEFITYYIYKRYYEKDKTVDNFIKADENIFKAAPTIPGSYFPGLAVLFLFQLIFGGIALIRIRRALKPGSQVPKPGQRAVDPELLLDEEDIRPGSTYFILRKNEEERHALFHSFENRENTACLDKPAAEDIDVGVRPLSLLTYLCEIRGTDLEYARKSVEILGMENLDKLERKDLTPEILKKIYAAAVLDEKSKTVVVNDFIREESKSFEEEFKNLLTRLEKEKKSILYLSSEMFEPGLRKKLLQEEIKDKIEKIDLKEVSLR